MAEVTFPRYYLDEFGRLRVGLPVTVFDSKLLHGKAEDVWHEVVNNVSGDASSVWDTNRVTLSVGANSSDYCIRQTKMRFNYIPAKSHNISITATVGEDANTTKRLGYFNTSTDAPYTDSADGLYFEHDGESMSVVLARGGVKRTIPESQWGAKLNGLVQHWGAPQIFGFGLQWLGVGEVRVSLKIGTVAVIEHTFKNANDGDGTGITVPYMESPNHSIRFEVRSNGGAGSMHCICSSVQSEGGGDLLGELHSANRGITAFTTGANTSTHPLLSLRLRADRPDGTILPQTISILCTTSAAYLWTLRLNPTIAGTDNASWANVGGNSCAEYDVSRTSANTVTGGTILASGYKETTNQSTGPSSISLNSAVRPGIGIDGTQDELVVCIQLVSAVSENFLAAINWQEPI